MLPLPNSNLFKEVIIENIAGDSMRPETEGKIMVVLIISLIGFGCGSGMGIVIGISQNDSSSPFSLNYTQPDDPQFPAVEPTSTQIQNNSKTLVDSNNNNEVYQDNQNTSNNNNSG